MTAVAIVMMVRDPLSSLGRGGWSTRVLPSVFILAKATALYRMQKCRARELQNKVLILFI